VGELDVPFLMLTPQVTYYRVADAARLDSRFLKFYFDSPAFQTLFETWGHKGSTRSYLGITSQLDLPIVLPPIDEQRAIAHILGMLDDKIELNRRMNETLDAMARALFKSWFMDFDPVRAKAEGRDPGLPKPLADLFPESFDDSELGEIPKGWRVEPFAAKVEIIGGGTPKTSVPEYWDGDIPWFSVVDAPGSADVWVMDTEKKITREGIENSSARILPVGTTIISARGTVGRIALVGVPMAMNQSCYGVQGKEDKRGFFTYFAARELVASLRQHAHGSVFDTITRDTLASVLVAVPSGDLIDAFGTRAAPSMERIRAGLVESRTLAALRDVLLPKLISGELRVKNAERFLEAREL
jgi:type I restriction enzyme S subunit